MTHDQELLAAAKLALADMSDLNGDYTAEETAVEQRLRKAIENYEQAAKREPVAQDAMAKDVMVERLAKHLCSKKYPNQDIEFQGGNEFKLWEYHIIEANEYLAIALTTPRGG